MGLLTSACGRKDGSHDEGPGDEFPITGETPDLDGKHLMPLRSVEDLNRIIRGRMVADETFDIINVLIGKSAKPGFEVIFGQSARDELATIMGVRQGLGLRIATDSLKPSTAHTLLWGLAFDAFAQALGLQCVPDAEDKLPLYDELRSTIEAVCSDSAAQPENLRRLWSVLLRQDGTEDERERWLHDELAEEEAGLQGEERVSAHVRSILLGPELLIGR